MPASPVNEVTPLVEPRTAQSWLPTLWLIGTANLGMVVSGYDVFVVDLAMAIIEKQYPGEMDPADKSLTVSAAMVGIIAGQLIFGCLGDILGRRLCGLITASLQTVAALLCAGCSTALPVTLAHQLAVCRLFLGLGIGGENPLASAMSVEGYSSPSFSGRVRLSPMQMMTTCSGLFKVGTCLASAFTLVLLQTNLPLEVVWRVSFAAGALPAAVSLVLRYRMEDSNALAASRQRRTQEVRTVEEASKDVMSKHSFLAFMIAASVASFCYNFLLYGQGSFKSVIAEDVFGGGSSIAAIVRRDALFGTCMAAAPVLVALSLLPVVDYLGTKKICTVAFAASTAFNALAGAVVMNASKLASISMELFVLFILSGACWGAIGVATMSVVVLNVPADIRGQYQGLTSAGGKVGALIGGLVFPLIEAGMGLSAVSLLCAGVSLVGSSVTATSFPHEDADPRILDSKPQTGLCEAKEA